MGNIDKDTLLSSAFVVRDEQTEGSNTAGRVGQLLVDIINAVGSVDDALGEYLLSDDLAEELSKLNLTKYLTKDEAGKTYLTINTASLTYLKKADFDDLFVKVPKNASVSHIVTQEEIDGAKAIVEAEGYEQGSDPTSEELATKTAGDTIYETKTIYVIKAKYSLYSDYGITAYGYGGDSGSGGTGGGATSLLELTDVSGTPTNGQVLYYNGTNFSWKSVAASWADINPKPTQSDLVSIIGNYYVRSEGDNGFTSWKSNTKLTLWGNSVPVDGGTCEGAITIKNGDKSVVLSVDDNGNLKIDNADSKANVYATGGISAYGKGDDESQSIAQYFYDLLDVKSAGTTPAANKAWGVKSVSNGVPVYDWIDVVTTSLAWGNITGKPSTLAGYGITDALSQSTADGRYLKLSGGDVTGCLGVGENLSVTGSVEVENYVSVQGTLYVNGDAALNSQLTVEDYTTLKGNLDVNGTVNIYSNLSVDDSVNIGSYLEVSTTLYVDEISTLNGGFKANANSSISGTLSVDEDIKLDGGKITSVSTIQAAENGKGDNILYIDGDITTNDTDGTFIQIGGARIVWDSTNNALKVVNKDGTSAANLYAVGGVSAYGYGEDDEDKVSHFYDLDDYVTPSSTDANKAWGIVKFENNSPVFGWIEAGKTYGGSAYIDVNGTTISVNSGYATNWNDAYTHSTSAHAPSNAQKNVQSDWDATSGDALILNKPKIYTADQCTTYTTDSGAVTPAAVKKAVGLFEPKAHTHSYVSALGTSGDDVTWTKDGTTNTLTVPFATKATTAKYIKTDEFSPIYYGGSNKGLTEGYLCLGYMKCTNNYDRMTLLITSAFWGNQHGSQDIITVQQSNNDNSGNAVIKCTVGRVCLGGSHERKFYYKKDDTNQKLWLYVYVTGGNSYGNWSVSYLGGNAEWNGDGTQDVTKEESWVEVGYSGIVGKSISADKLSNTRTLWGQNFNGEANVSGNMSGVGNIIFNTNQMVLSASSLDNTYNKWDDENGNTHPWYGYDHRYVNTGVNSTVIADYFGMRFKTAQGDVVLTQAGTFGIGTTTPAEKLDVVGNARVSGYVKIGSAVLSYDATKHLLTFSDATSGQVLNLVATGGITAYGEGSDDTKKVNNFYDLNDYVTPVATDANKAWGIVSVDSNNKPTFGWIEAGKTYGGSTYIGVSGTTISVNFDALKSALNIPNAYVISKSDVERVLTGTITTHNHSSITSLGAKDSESGRTADRGGVYQYTMNASTGGFKPVTYASVIGFGQGTKGSGEIAVCWTGGVSQTDTENGYTNGLYYRGLRDVLDNWYGWTKILDTHNFVAGTDYVAPNGNAGSATKLATACSLWGNDFDGSANVNGNILVNITTSASASVCAKNTNGAVSIVSSTNRGLYDNTGDNWIIGTNGINTWASVGNFGIGTLYPSEKLHISDETKEGNVATLYTNKNFNMVAGVDSVGGFVWGRANTPLRFGTNSAERIRITTGGNVGINTNSPTEILEVNGNVKATKFIGELDGSADKVDGWHVSQINAVSGYVSHDLAAFCNYATPTYRYSTDGTTWTEGTLSKRLFVYCSDKYEVISDTKLGSQFEWKFEAYCSLSMVILAADYTAKKADVSITFESRAEGSSTWTNRGTFTSYASAIFNEYSVNSIGSDVYFRITILRTSTDGTMTLNGIRIISPRSGAQGKYMNYDYPYYADGDKNIYPWSNDSAYLGIQQNRWKGVYSVKVDASQSMTAPTFIGNLQGNADTATKLKAKVKLWGNDFDGSAAVNGDITIATKASDDSYIQIGGKKIYYDRTNDCLKFEGDVYATGGISAYGLGKDNNESAAKFFYDLSDYTSSGIGTDKAWGVVSMNGTTPAFGWITAGKTYSGDGKYVKVSGTTISLDDGYVANWNAAYNKLSSLGTAANHSEDYFVKTGDEGYYVDASTCVTSIGSTKGNITLRNGLSSNGAINLTMSGQQLQASIVGLGSLAYKSSLTTSDVSEGTNKYFTNARAQSALSGHTGDTTVHITSDEREDWDSAFEKSHTHTNKATLDNIDTDTLTLWGQTVKLKDKENTANGDITIKNANGKYVKISVDSDGNLKIDNGTNKANLYATGSITAYGVGGDEEGKVSHFYDLTDYVAPAATDANKAWGIVSMSGTTPVFGWIEAGKTYVGDGTYVKVKGTTISLDSAYAANWNAAYNKLSTLGTAANFSENHFALASSVGTYVTQSTCVTSIGDVKGNITLLNKQTGNGKINLTMSGKQLQASIEGLKDLAYKSSLGKSDVGLGNVDNTADANKSVNYATSAGSAGYATSAGGATNDGGGNNIVSTYLNKTTGGTITGNLTLQNNTTDKHQLLIEHPSDGPGAGHYNISWYWGSGSNEGFKAGYINASPLVLNLRSGGNVGINIDSPQYKLDVNGSGRFTEKVGIGTTPNALYYLTTPSAYVSGKINVGTQYESGCYLTAQNAYIGVDGNAHVRVKSDRIEMYASTPFIDFHTGNGADYTHLINDASGRLSIYDTKEKPSLRIGNAVLSYDYSKNMLMLEHAEGSAMNLLSTGAMTAYALNGGGEVGTLSNLVVSNKVTANTVVASNFRIQPYTNDDGNTVAEIGYNSSGNAPDILKLNASTVECSDDFSASSVSASSVSIGGKIKVGTNASEITNVKVSNGYLYLTVGSNKYRASLTSVTSY